jgi:hypothetical protein
LHENTRLRVQTPVLPKEEEEEKEEEKEGEEENQCECLTPVILATWEAKIGRICLRDPASTKKAGYGAKHLSFQLFPEA